MLSIILIMNAQPILHTEYLSMHSSATVGCHFKFGTHFSTFNDCDLYV